MFYEVVAIARDWAIILLVLQGILLCALPLLVLYKSVEGMGGFLPKVRPGLRGLHAWLQGIIVGMERVLAAIRAPFLWVQSVEARLRGSWQAWKRG